VLIIIQQFNFQLQKAQTNQRLSDVCACSLLVGGNNL